MFGIKSVCMLVAFDINTLGANPLRVNLVGISHGCQRHEKSEQKRKRKKVVQIKGGLNYLTYIAFCNLTHARALVDYESSDATLV